MAVDWQAGKFKTAATSGQLLRKYDVISDLYIADLAT